MRMVETYPRVTQPGHFMALFKMAMTNKMHDRSLYTQRKKCVEVLLPEDASTYFQGRIGEVTNAGYLMALLAEEPELQLVLETLARGLPIEKPSKKRENLSMRLCRILGLGPDKDPIASLKRILTQ